ncbi:hypothetical protein ABT324_11580 [Saccharopolyspora sp. NPDC000359]|uniref:hypothetical protein n=1 Tax=Saccharopolyspora sp. NPDC000359 TaxID=3154251 RepID=UPI00332B3E52
MTISRRQYGQMLRAYVTAWESIEKAAGAFEDGSAMISAAGEQFVRPSGVLLAEMHQMCSALKVWLNTFESEAEIEKE